MVERHALIMNLTILAGLFFLQFPNRCERSAPPAILSRPFGADH